MNILTRHLAFSIIQATLLVLLVLVAIDMAFLLLREVDSVGKGDYQLIHAFLYILLTMPGRVYLFFPTAVLLGSLLGLGQLANQSELVVMRAAGLSRAGIIRRVLKIGCGLAVFIVVLGEYVAAPAEQYAQQKRMELQSRQISVQGGEGLWIRDDNRYIKIARVLPGMHLQDIKIYEFQDQRLSRSIHAASAQYTDAGWLLSEIKESQLSPEAVSTHHQNESLWERFIDPSLFAVLQAEPSAMSLLDLYRYAGYLKDNGLEYDSYELILWRKLAVPVAILVMLVLSVPFVFGNLRDSGSGQRVLIGSVIGIAYFLLDRLFNHIGLAFGLPTVLAAFLPLMMFSLLAAYLLYRLR